MHMLLFRLQILDYYQYCSLINKVYQLAEEKDVAALEEMSSSEVGSWFHSLKKKTVHWNKIFFYSKGFIFVGFLDVLGWEVYVRME
jgi:hypothetical protein